MYHENHFLTYVCRCKIQDLGYTKLNLSSLPTQIHLLLMYFYPIKYLLIIFHTIGSFETS